MAGQPILVAISGLMGSGKTTLARAMAERLRWRYVPESAPATKYLFDLFRDPTRWAFETQVAFFCQKAVQLQDALAQGENVVLDRSLNEDYLVFARYFAERGAIDERALDTYQSLAEHFRRELPPPNLVIYCRCPLAVLRSRMLARGRDYQRAYPPEHLQEIQVLFDEWMQAETCPIYAIASDRHDWRARATVDDICGEVVWALRKPNRDRTQLWLFPQEEVPERIHTFKRLELVSEGVPSQSGPRFIQMPTRGRRGVLRGYPSIYLAAPFTGQMEVEQSPAKVATLFSLAPGHGRILPGRYRRMLTGMANSMEKLGLFPVLPHRDINDWGSRQLPPTEVMRLCAECVSRCDCFVGILGESHGSHAEYGIARGLGKPCIIVRCDEIPDSFIARGIEPSNTAHLVLRCARMPDVPRVLLSNEVREFLRRYVPLAERTIT